MHISQATKAIQAFINKDDHTLSTRDLINITGCMSPSNLASYLVKNRKCQFSKTRNKRLINYTLINVNDYTIVGEG